MGRFSNKMWKVLGAQSTRNQSRSVAQIEQSAAFDEWAQGLSDDEFPDAALALDVYAAKSDDRAKFIAIAREGADRALGLRPFDVQLQGADRLLEGDVVEMATGEGKTLAGAVAAAGMALAGRSVHVISPNDYLARRDAEWMKPFFDLLDVTVGYVAESSTREERREAYAKDVVYGSVNEIGFDVLRDQLATRAEDLLSPKPDVAIVDEADSVLVDEALIPLVLAGSVKGDVPQAAIMEVVARLREGKHYEIDADGKSAFLTDDGAKLVEEELGGIDLYSDAHVASTLPQVNIALHAYALVERDVHYIVRDGQVKLINSSRGRVAELQRWPDGLQAAVEAKEGLSQTDSGEVIDTITVQALLQRYALVCGMTGTAIAAGEQLRQFYDLGVSQIPPNTPNIRVDQPMRVYDNKGNKVAGIVDYVREVHETGQPVLIGTHDVAESEELAHMLKISGVIATVLNAKNDADEARIIADAGTKGAVTVSTQMAGRGTDIKLGGHDAGDESPEHDEVAELGGLAVVGTGLHDTERLDQQLRGRAGRQGDPGTSVIFASVEDPIVERHLPLKRPPGGADPETGEFPRGKAADMLDSAQRVAEGGMLETHANTWRYNQLVNQQRDLVMARRHTLLTTERPLEDFAELEPERLAELREAGIEDDVLEQAAREAFLYHLDRAWAEHLAFVSEVQTTIHLRALGRQSPLDEFHRLVIEEFRKLPEEAVSRARETLREAEITADGIDLDGADLGRNTLTWTYMVHDNPFATKGMANMFGMI
ncbi:accessory Sec system translocase SecA2 [Tsukamurella tyrosinosolvens]|uniref:Protein translocase subunit SecA n=1 Tax=Tsukamurella tyrosinosolvens TaxID=57704 RepID=A0A1H4W071_TSUTY|nr:accessory Sec system translocase SecA2 [Tsukamurella tyrosinosolvens]AUN40762.1 accessory Sec system translocase SecA2 [Tsukamurella tyrosinosolvens]KXO90668.1 accessory Sec system translocase SecA2 [Tsukamurella tyrosinosolvens]KXP06219.1 accessory Sec system translocase SecA2 [Tsukamurella tyrosinosolvens]KZL96051.1 accessory Sec system translocase SecA2 [Tsukamurella tyrosinosolvens]MCA4993112.1 accessory Sec system translocase SecA2 [Tsukamurella tyrosinosolvens]